MRAFRLRGEPAFGAGLLAAAALLAACGGGGGGSGSGNAGGGAGEGADAACTRTASGCLSAAAYRAAQNSIIARYRNRADFRSQPALDLINAEVAYANLELAQGAADGRPGQGITLGLIDNRVDTAHPALDGAKVVEVNYVGTGASAGTPAGHGTPVASILAGDGGYTFSSGGRRRAGPRGVASAARLRSFVIHFDTPVRSYDPIDLAARGAAENAEWTRIWGEVLGTGIDVLNLSIGYDGGILDYSEADLRRHFPTALRAMAQPGRSSNKTLFVWSAGNPGAKCYTDSNGACVSYPDKSSVQVSAGLMARIPELRGHSVAVVAVDTASGAVADFSSHCGIAADWCLAAPGTGIAAAAPGGGGFASWSGTSAAAPMVSGGLALMKQYFRGQLSNEQLLARMLATADKSGRYANEAVYGQGLLNLGAAVSPVGSSTLAAGARVGGAGADVRHTRLESGAALGDGLARSLRGREAAAFDELGAPFWHDLGVFAPRAEAADAGALLRDFMAAEPAEPAEPGGSAWAAPGGAALRYSARLLRPAAAAPGDHLALAGRAVSLRAERPDGWSADFFATDDDAAAPARGAVLAWRPREREGEPRLRAGWLTERKTLLGSRAEGAFGALRGDLVFGGAGGSFRAGAWTLSADAELGAAAPETGGGLLEDVPRLVTSAFRLRAERPAAGGAWRVSLAQPLRVERGEALLSVPVGRTPEGDVLRQRLAADLEPSGRQLDLSAHWRQPLAGGELRLGSVWTRHPGHRADASSEWTLLAGWRADF